MNILILGGNGFIGSHIAEKLFKLGHKITIYDRSNGNINISASFIKGDFLKKDQLNQAMVGVEVVVHCISTTVPSTSAKNPVYDIESNLLGTVGVIQAMKDHKVRKLIYLSSGGTVYGQQEVSPVNELSLLNPISTYGAVKVAIEKFIGIATFAGDIESAIIRPSNPYGARQMKNNVQGLITTILYNKIIKKVTKIYGDGSIVRDYIYVDDLAELIGNVITYNEQGVYNAGFGQGYSINEIIDTIEIVTGSAIIREYEDKRKFDVKEIILDCSKAKEKLNWIPKVSIESGIRETFEVLKERY